MLFHRLRDIFASRRFRFIITFTAAAVGTVGYLPLASRLLREPRIPHVAVSFDKSGEVVVQDWFVVGPFANIVGVNPSVRDELDRNRFTGLTEKAVTPVDLHEVLQGRYSKQQPSGTTIRSPSEVLNLQDVYKEHGVETGTAYVAVNLESASARDVVLSTGSAFGLKVWLNQEPVVDEDEADGYRSSRYRDFSQVHLRAGPNFLLAKVVSRKHDWMLSLSVMTRTTARAKAAEVFRTEVLDSNIIPTGMPLVINPELFHGEEGAIVLRHVATGRAVGHQERQQIRESHTYDLATASPGLYSLTLSIADRVVKQDFYYGRTPSQLVRVYEAAISSYRRDRQLYATLYGLVFRLKHLCLPHNFRPHSGFWQRKAMFSIQELERVLAALGTGTEPFRGVTGLHLRSYTSSTDDIDQYYQVYVPTSGKQRKPLAIIIPYVSDPKRPFLESTHVARINVVQKIARIAEERGMITVWAAARGGNSYAEPIAVADVLDLLHHLQAEYSIDSDRVYLIGTCSGARDAVMIASRFPHLFAAVGLITPATTREMLIEDELAPDPTASYAASWLASMSPVSVARNLANLPVYIIHADRDPHMPVRQSLEFIEAAKRHGWAPSFEIMKGGTIAYFPDDPWPKLFRFFANKSRIKPTRVEMVMGSRKYNQAHWLRIDRVGDATVPAALSATLEMDRKEIVVNAQNVCQYTILPGEMPTWDPGLRVVTIDHASARERGRSGQAEVTISLPCSASSRAGTGVGPVSDVFSDSFLVVRGTTSESTNRPVVAWFEAMSTAWRARYFSSLPSVRDRDVLGPELRNRNLLLIGADDANSVSQRMSELRGERFSSTEALINGKRFQDHTLGYIILAPNPYNPRKYVVRVNPTDCIGQPSVTLQLAAWYDYVVWRGGSGEKCSIIAVGSGTLGRIL